MLRLLFENAGPLVARLSKEEPFESPAQMVERAREVLRHMTPDEQIAVVNAHPRIGADPSSLKLQSTTSYDEQGNDHDTASDDVMAELRQLNDEYERRFGFRFVIFVNRRTKAEILPIFRARLENSREQELNTALGEVLAIAEDRSRRR